VKSHGPAPVKVIVRVVLDPLHIVVDPVIAAVGLGLTVRVTAVPGPWHPLLLVSVTYTVVVWPVTVWKPSSALVGVVPLAVVNKVVNPASLYHLYVLVPTGLDTVGAVIV
jgi:hypothetical protein